MKTRIEKVKIKITVFQALTILAEKYIDDDLKSVNIKKLYLSGIRNEKDNDLLHKLLKDKALKPYIICNEKSDITNDPVRRYFESILCLETLSYSLDKLNLNLLKESFNSIFSFLPFKLQLAIPATIYQNRFMETAQKQSQTAKEYAEAIKLIGDKNSFDYLKSANTKEAKKQLQKNKRKILLIVKSAHAAMSAVASADPEKYPLNLYGTNNSAYSATRRGRINREIKSDTPKEPNQKQGVQSNSFGIMRSFMPLAKTDPLFSESGARYVRCPDRSDYVEGAEQVEKSFATQVTPFVNSISGTLLCQLRLMMQLRNENRFIYENNPEQLKLYFKNYIAYLIHDMGGHSLDEFMRVFELPDVKEEFKTLAGFDQLKLETLFKNENENAFKNAIKMTILYNQNILLKRKLHHQIISDKKNLAFRINCSQKNVVNRYKSNLEKVLELINVLYAEYKALGGKSHDKDIRNLIHFISLIVKDNEMDDKNKFINILHLIEEAFNKGIVSNHKHHFFSEEPQSLDSFIEKINQKPDQYHYHRLLGFILKEINNIEPKLKRFNYLYVEVEKIRLPDDRKGIYIYNSKVNRLIDECEKIEFDQFVMKLKNTGAALTKVQIYRLYKGQDVMNGKLAEKIWPQLKLYGYDSSSIENFLNDIDHKIQLPPMNEIEKMRKLALDDINYEYQLGGMSFEQASNETKAVNTFYSERNIKYNLNCIKHAIDIICEQINKKGGLERKIA